MSGLCGLINSGITADCTNPLQAGTEDTLVLLNRTQIASLTKNGTNPQIIEDIIMESAALGYVFEGLNNSITPKSMMVKGRYFRNWSHEVNFIAFDVSPDAKAVIEDAKDGDFVAIVYNKYRGLAGNSAFEIYGLYAGLKAETIERDVNNAETQGAFNILLKTDNDRGLEPFQPQTLYITDYATSLAVVEGLL
jgi:hypothetical protein